MSSNYKHGGNYRFSVTLLGALLLVTAAAYSSVAYAVGCRGPDEPPCPCCPETAGTNRFDVFSGNVHRAIKDLEIWGGRGGASTGLDAPRE